MLLLLWRFYLGRRLVREGKVVSARVLRSVYSPGLIRTVKIDFQHEDRSTGKLKARIGKRPMEELPKEGDQIYLLWRNEEDFAWL